jgi:hypothetical protein
MPASGSIIRDGADQFFLCIFPDHDFPETEVRRHNASAQPQDSKSSYIFNADRSASNLLLEDSHNPSDFSGVVSISTVRHVTEGESDNPNELLEPLNDVAQLLYDIV